MQFFSELRGSPVARQQSPQGEPSSGAVSAECEAHSLLHHPPTLSPQQHQACDSGAWQPPCPSSTDTRLDFSPRQCHDVRLSPASTINAISVATPGGHQPHLEQRHRSRRSGTVPVTQEDAELSQSVWERVTNRITTSGSRQD
jgi:hypothetical protein